MALVNFLTWQRQMLKTSPIWFRNRPPTGPLRCVLHLMPTSRCQLGRSEKLESPVYPIRPYKTGEWPVNDGILGSYQYTPVNDRLMSFDPSDGNMASPRSALPIAAYRLTGPPWVKMGCCATKEYDRKLTEYMTEYVQNAMCSISKWYNKTYRPWPTRGFTSCASIFWCGKFKGLRNWLFKSVQPVPLELMPDLCFPLPESIWYSNETRVCCSHSKLVLLDHKIKVLWLAKSNGSIDLGRSRIKIH